MKIHLKAIFYTSCIITFLTVLMFIVISLGSTKYGLNIFLFSIVIGFLYLCVYSAIKSTEK